MMIILALSLCSSKARSEYDPRIIGLSVIGSTLSMSAAYKLTDRQPWHGYLKNTVLLTLGVCLVITSKEIVAEYDVYVIKKNIENSVFNWSNFLRWWKEQSE